MKTFYCILLLTLTFLGMPNNTFAQEPKVNIVGTWTFDYEASFRKMETSSKSLFNTMKLSQQQTIEKLYKNRKVIFNIDGSYSLILADGRKLVGSWKVTNKTLIITNASGMKDVQKIEALTNKALVLKPISKGKEKALISQWHFTKK